MKKFKQRLLSHKLVIIALGVMVMGSSALAYTGSDEKVVDKVERCIESYIENVENYYEGGMQEEGLGGTIYNRMISFDGGISVKGVELIDSSGNMDVAGTLGVTGATTLSSTLSAGATTIVATSGDVLTVNNTGTGKGLYINDTVAGQPALEIVANNDNTDNAVQVTLNGVGNGFLVTAATTTAASRQAFRVYSNVAQDAGNTLADFFLDDTGSTIPVVNVRNDGTGAGMVIDQNGESIALSIDASATSTIEVKSSGSLGACLKLEDIDGGAYTYVTVLNGTLTASTTSCE